MNSPRTASQSRVSQAASVVAAIFLSAFSWSIGVAAEDRLNLRIVESGHSLTDPIIEPLRAMAIASGAQPSVVIEGSTIPGSPMEWRWDHKPDVSKPDARADIADFDLLVMTERVPLSNTVPYHNSAESALEWFNHAYRNGSNGSGAETLLYATWVDIDSGPQAENPYNDEERHIPLRERLPLEFERWSAIADHVNDNRPAGSVPMRIIPATLVVAAAYDEIVQGSAPELTDIADLFEDAIHVNGVGAYLIALTQFMVIYGEDPRELPNDIGLGAPLSPELMEWMQNLVWDVVSSYQVATSLSLPAADLQRCIWSDLRGAVGACLQLAT